MTLSKQPSLMTAHKVEKITALRRVEEKRVSELSRYSQESRWLSKCAEKEAVIDQVRESSLNARRAEEELQRKLLLEKQSIRQRELATQELQRKLAVEIHRQKTELEKKEREVQRICDNSRELKELESQIKIAYVNKERAAQHQEAMLLRKLENDRQQAIEEKMEIDRRNDILRQQEREMERRSTLIAQKKELQHQMAETEKQKEALREEALRDKKMIDDIIFKISKDDELEQQERHRKVEETRTSIAEFQNERELRKKAIEKELQEQEAEILAYHEMLKQRNIKVDLEKRRLEEEKERRWKKVMEQTSNHNQSKMELDNLRALLWEEELEAKQKKEEEDAIRKRLQIKEDMMTENKAQIAAKRDNLLKMEQEEKDLVDRMMKKFAEDAEDDKMKEENRRAFKQRFMAETKAQQIERAKIASQETERELKEQEALRLQDEYKQRIINEARKKLLEQHAEQLQGFMPRMCQK